MYKYEVVNSEKLKFYIKLTVANGKDLNELKFSDIRGGFSHGTADSKPFWVIVGQPWLDPKLYVKAPAEYELLAEREYDGLDLDERHQLMLADGQLFCCDFNADLTADHQDENYAYFEFRRERRVRNGDLQPASYVDNFRLGVEALKSLFRQHRLIIPKDSICFDQLSRITTDDLATPDLKERFYAIEALRHAITSYRVQPVIVPQDYGPSFSISHEDSGQNWMA